MSLVGNLEDLGLGDILQIVSLSRKSGVLALTSRNREGRVVFHNGQVIRATSSVFQENIGDLVVRERLVDLPMLKRAVLIQKKNVDPRRLGTILAEEFGVSKDAIEEAVKNQVEKIVYSFFAWDEGTFSFELGEPTELGATSLDPFQFMLDQGLNPQWLAMEGSRILDEKMHRGESLEDEAQASVVDLESLLGDDAPASGEGAEELETDAAAAPQAHGLPVLLVDDDPLTAAGIQKVLRNQGFAARAFSSGHEFLNEVADAVEADRAPILLVDLIMPRLNGTGILGGLELVELIQRKYPQLTLLVLSDYPNQEAENKVRSLGIPAVVPKPRKNELHEQSGIAALEELVGTIRALLGRGSAKPEDPSAAPLFNLGAELLQELGEEGEAPGQGRGPESPGLYLLRGMLEELNNPSLGGGIILLVLRFASELMNRAVIFLAKGKEIVGLGQFGIECEGEMADARVRRMKIAREENSVFSRLLVEKAPMKVTLGNGAGDAYLKEQLGASKQGEVFLGPILSEGKVVAVIYGDNYPDETPIGNTEALEIFLSQAGLAMEKALLERRLRGKEAV